MQGALFLHQLSCGMQVAEAEAPRSPVVRLTCWVHVWAWGTACKLPGGARVRGAGCLTLVRMLVPVGVVCLGLACGPAWYRTVGVTPAALEGRTALAPGGMRPGRPIPGPAATGAAGGQGGCPPPVV